MSDFQASKLNVNGKLFDYYAPESLAFAGISDTFTLSRLPFSIKILLENAMRHANSELMPLEDIKALANWRSGTQQKVRLVPSRVVLHQPSTSPSTSGGENADVIFEHNGVLSPDTLVCKDLSPKLSHYFGLLNLEVADLDTDALRDRRSASFVLKDVFGIELNGQPKTHTSAKEIVSYLAQILQKQDVSGQIIEFFGSGLRHLTWADRAKVKAMALECGAVSAVFPVDQQTLAYLRSSDRSNDHIEKVEQYAKAIGIWYDQHIPNPSLVSLLKVNLSTLELAESLPDA